MKQWKKRYDNNFSNLSIFEIVVYDNNKHIYIYIFLCYSKKFIFTSKNRLLVDYRGYKIRKIDFLGKLDIRRNCREHNRSLHSTLSSFFSFSCFFFFDTILEDRETKNRTKNSKKISQFQENKKFPHIKVSFICQVIIFEYIYVSI